MLTPDDVHNADFARAWRRDRGYDEDEVDDFLDRVDATLSGEDTVTAHEALRVRFSSRKRGGRAYKKTQVDAFLEKVALTLLKREVQESLGEPEETGASKRKKTRRDRQREEQVAQEKAARQRVAEARRQSGRASDHEGKEAQQLSVELGPEIRLAPRKPAARPREEIGAAEGSRAIEGHRPSAENRPPAAEPVPADPPQVRPEPVEAAYSPEPVSPPPGAGSAVLDKAEVDAFVDRVEATLRGADTLTAQEVLNAHFNPPLPGRPGYQEASVVAFLMMLSTSIKHLSPPERSVPAQRMPIARAFHREQHAPQLTPEAIHNVALHSPAESEPGYHSADVDEFLDRVEATLRGADVLTAYAVHAVRFREVPPGGGGYDQEEVESLMDLIADCLARAARPVGAWQ